jgi:hypothetical protein
MNHQIEKINQEIASLRQEIINHKVYAHIKNLDDLQVFMQYHVFAVWDFMSLLKSLQNKLTCTTVPWFPVGSADTRHLINEIVVGEESDIDQDGNRISHFELYLKAMQQCGTNTQTIDRFLEALQNGENMDFAFETAKVPQAARMFVQFTFDIINSDKAYLQAAIFTFGREDLIPGMFLAIINDMYQEFPEEVGIFKYYLDRHIEVDGDHHSHLALQMTSNLCGDNVEYWKEAQNAIIASLKKRITLWDGVYEELLQKKEKAVLS